jgi:MFS family permease
VVADDDAKAGTSPLSQPASPAAKTWIPSFAGIVFCEFLFFVTINFVQPFLPLYLRELGATEQEAIFWTGLMNSVGAGVAFFSMPLWGRMADRVGSRPIILRGLIGTVFTMALMGASQVPWHVMVGRVSGTIMGGAGAAMMGFAAKVLPPNRLGLGLGIMQTAQSVGLSLGPLLAGIVASYAGYRGAIQTASVLMVLVLIVGYFVIREPEHVRAAARTSAGLLESIRTAARLPSLRQPLLGVIAFQGAYYTGFLLLPLHIESIAGLEASTDVGLILSANALGMATGGILFGWLTTRLGSRRVALMALVLATVFTLPQFWIQDIPLFVVVRFLAGLGYGGSLPTLRAVMGEGAARDPRMANSLGSLYGLNQSAFAMGMTLGSVGASVVAGFAGLAATHLLAGLSLLATALWWMSRRSEARLA